jgi:hypothetical protein
MTYLRRWRRRGCGLLRWTVLFKVRRMLGELNLPRKVVSATKDPSSVPIHQESTIEIKPTHGSFVQKSEPRLKTSTKVLSIT